MTVISHPAIDRVAAVERELRGYLIGRDLEIHGLLLALVARSHVFLLGSPGSGKSYLATEVARRVEGARTFRIDLHPYTLRDELFGPVSLGALRDRDALERKYVGYLPDAHIAVLDELFKAPGASLNTMLTLLNEREFRNDDTLVRAPLISAFTTSNELPPADRSLGALYDRILLRFRVDALTDPDARRAATEGNLRLRSFDAAARRIWAGVGEVGELRPERYAIDVHGRVFADEELRDRAADGTLPGLPDADDPRRELIVRLATWARETGLLLPYRNRITLDDLEALHAMAIAASMPRAVEEAFYGILSAEGVGGRVSVRREAELRVLLGAQATLSGRGVVALEDLRVAIDALWDVPETRGEVVRVVNAETRFLENELKSLEATIEGWRSDMDADDAISTRTAMLRDMDRELRRLSELAEAHPSEPRVAALLTEAESLRKSFEERLFGED